VWNALGLAGSTRDSSVPLAASTRTSAGIPPRRVTPGSAVASATAKAPCAHLSAAAQGRKLRLWFPPLRVPPLLLLLLLHLSLVLCGPGTEGLGVSRVHARQLPPAHRVDEDQRRCPAPPRRPRQRPLLRPLPLLLRLLVLVLLVLLIALLIALLVILVLVLLLLRLSQVLGGPRTEAPGVSRVDACQLPAACSVHHDERRYSAPPRHPRQRRRLRPREGAVLALQRHCPGP